LHYNVIAGRVPHSLGISSVMLSTHDRHDDSWPDTNVLHVVHIPKSRLASTVAKAKRPKMQHNSKLSPSSKRIGHDNGSADRRIRAFLAGETHGEDVLGALYGHVADEPMPQRLRALLRR